ncbi:FeoA domain-containing protein [Bacteroidota bacterium]
MGNPLLALILVSSVLVLLIIFFIPGKGIIARRRRNKSNTRRVLIEDALKNLYEIQYKKLKNDLDSLTNNLSISEDAALKLIDNLIATNLVTRRQDVLRLTAEGEAYALKIIRIHRLWEKYLADETSVKETDWHPEAEIIEHDISEEEAEKLAAKLGNPLFDPHGDPIPTAEGDLPEHKGKPLTQLKEGEIGVITHIEDEPPAVYAQLIAEGLQIGNQIKVIEKSENRIRFIADGNECLLAPMLAENLTIESIADDDVIEGEFRVLTSLRTGETARVVGISQSCRGRQRRRLMDFGIVPGADITAELESVGRDPVAYRIRETSIALRNQQADQIFIEEIKKEIKVA